MSNSELTTDTGYQSLLGKISEVYATGQARAARRSMSISPRPTGGLAVTLWSLNRAATSGRITAKPY